MIDLRFKGLPHTVVVDGEDYEVETDFRVWIEAERELRETGSVAYWVFAGEHPSFLSDWKTPVLEFMASPNPTPRSSGDGGGPRLFDFVDDGEYIVASFMQAYGIDLTTADMHWHLFRALFNGLPDDTKMARIMSYRAYDPADAKRKREAVMSELRNAWALPKENDAESLSLQQKLFGSIAESYKQQEVTDG